MSYLTVDNLAKTAFRGAGPLSIDHIHALYIRGLCLYHNYLFYLKLIHFLA